MKNEMTMKEKRFSFFADPQERKAESQPTFGTLPFARHTSQRFAKAKEPNLADTQFFCMYFKMINFDFLNSLKKKEIMKKANLYNQYESSIQNIKSMQTRMVVERETNYKLILLFCILLFNSIVFANNVAVTNLSVPDADHIQFDISWDNSWYTATNYDAIWIFIKAQDCAGTSTWDHVSLSTVAINHSVTGGLYVEPSSDGKGVFIRLNANGFGSQAGTAVLQFSAAIPAFATTNFHVFGVEMVWTPTAAFQVGDGSLSHTAGVGSAYNFGSPVNTTGPYTISSEGNIAAGQFNLSLLRCSNS